MTPASQNAPTGPDAVASTHETIVLAGGCFWCLDAVYRRTRGVLAVESGYANGDTPAPTYEQVCTGRTGYAEVVRVTFDPAVVTLAELLQIFFVIHDPTTRDRQGNDVGPQYRSAIFTTRDAQLATAREVMDEARHAARARGADVVTQLEPLRNYVPAEAYHQDYFRQHPGQGYCAFVVAPKVEKFRHTFAQLVRD